MRKGKKHRFSEEEKQLIKEMKSQLSMMDVPREEWSSIIQRELKHQQKLKKKTQKSSEPKSGISAVVDNIKKKIKNAIFKLFKKRLIPKELRGKEGQLEDFLEMFDGNMEDLSRDDLNMMNAMMGGFQMKDVDDMSSHGTFVAERPDKKRMIVSFDDEEE
ncbi:MAG: hypothetical protein GF353_23560 [Candidatus Lokiarchaeota archaeon]|nr:hypothetical protein [Candidatus Lokiarchaeota archaeon]